MNVFPVRDDVSVRPFTGVTDDLLHQVHRRIPSMVHLLTLLSFVDDDFYNLSEGPKE